VNAAYRITVRGVMSERFCRGFPGLDRHVLADRTVLEGDPGGRPVNDVLAMLGNLGVEVLSVEEPVGAAPPPEES